jgi:hypothetical protein
MKKSDLNGLKLTFEYCECGCHGHSANAGRYSSFWIYTELDENNKVARTRLYRGHGFAGGRVGEFTTFKQAVNKANSIMRDEVRKMLESLGG